MKSQSQNREADAKHTWNRGGRHIRPKTPASSWLYHFGKIVGVSFTNNMFNNQSGVLSSWFKYGYFVMIHSICMTSQLYDDPCSTVTRELSRVVGMWILQWYF